MGLVVTLRSDKPCVPFYLCYVWMYVLGSRGTCWRRQTSRRRVGGGENKKKNALDVI